MKLKDTIGIFPNAFTKEQCQLLINKFDYENELDNFG